MAGPDPKIIGGVVLLLCVIASLVAAMMMGGEKKEEPTEKDDDKKKDESEDEDEDEDEDESEFTAPASFANKSFDKLGNWRINPMKSGYEYRQFFVKDLPNAVKECEAACKDDSLCPGYSIDWHAGDNVNCMVYQANSGKGTVPSCKNKPFSGCTHDVRGKPGVTEGGTWWRGP